MPYEPKAGDVVHLRSEPSFPMTVAGYDPATKLYGVVWLDEEARAHAVNLTAAALEKHEAKEDAAPTDDPRVLAMLEELGSLRDQLNREMNANHGRVAMVARCCLVLQQIVPQEQWSSDLETMAKDAMRHHETMRREANEQLAALARRVQELGG